MDKKNILIKSHPENLRRVRALMTDILSISQISEQDSQMITLAIDEACSNIIKHGYKNNYNQKIDITVDLKTELLTITIIDEGIKFNIHSIEPRDVSKIRPGGLGIHIIKQVMDSVEYRQTSDGLNKVTLIKKLLP